MFPQRVGSTIFTEPSTATAFKNISGDAVCDMALTSVLRAILTKKDAHIRTNFLQYDGDVDDAERINDYLCHDEDVLSVVDIRSGKPADDLADKLLGFNDGWTQVKRVTKCYEADFVCICLVNAEKRNTMLVIERIDTAKIHYVTASMVCWFPWFFTSMKDLSAEDRALLSSFRERSSDAFYEAIGAYEDIYDFYVMKLECINGFEERWKDAEIETTQRKIRDYDAENNRFYKAIAENLKKKEDACIRLNGLKYGTAEDKESIMDYFKDNSKRVRYISSDDSSLLFEILTTVMYFDPDEAENVYNNKRSYVYSEQRGAVTSKQMAEVFKAVFIDQTVKLRFTAQYKMIVREMEVEGIASATYSTAAAKYFPNPHIERYHCIGGYEEVLCRAMEAHNYIGVIEQCAVSAASLNFFDGTVFAEFMRRLYNLGDSRKKCFVLPDGTDATLKEVIKFIGGNDEEKTEEEDG